tara:strand:+ start:1314 stop:1850 length:537 start_codon:yes stop_codon:yes gene_type:complete
MHLYDISDGIRAVQEAMEHDEENPEAWQQALTDLEGEFEDKATGIGLLLVEWELEAKTIQAEAQRLSSRASAITNRHGRLKDYLLTEMQKAGIPKIKSPLVTLGIQNSTPSVVIPDITALPSNFVRVTLRMGKVDVPEDLVGCIVSEEPEKAAIGLLLKDGATVPGATLHQGQHLRVR